MDSKNVIWLSSFFALLFITFCVTRHLDDLNPNIVSINHHDKTPELIAKNDIQSIAVPKLETPKLETPKLETPKLETPKLETPKLETPKQLTEMVTIVKPKPVSLPILTPTKKEKPILKEVVSVTKHIKKPSKKTVHKRKKHLKMYDIGEIHLNNEALNTLSQKRKLNELNKLAYIHSINKGSFLTIYAHNQQEIALLKRYLQTQNVHNKNMKVIVNPNNNLTKITLTGRK